MIKPMTPDQRARFDRIAEFREGLLCFKSLLEATRSQSTVALPYSEHPPAAGGELEALRQKLLRARGHVEPIFVRVIGRLVQPGPMGLPSDSVWQIALQGHHVYSQPYYVQVLADEINTLLGRLEGEP